MVPKSATTGNKETKNGWMPWNWGYDFYKGNVFVAVTDPMLASMIHNNQYWSKDTYRAMTQKAEAAMRERGCSWTTVTIKTYFLMKKYDWFAARLFQPELSTIDFYNSRV